MFKSIANFLYQILKLFDRLCLKITKRGFLIWLKEFIENESYKSIKILNRKIIFFTPNYITKWLIDEFYTKEPETLEWIENFSCYKKNKKKRGGGVKKFFGILVQILVYTLFMQP